VYIESERLGRVSLGQQLLAADGVAGVSVANTLYGANADHSNGLFVIDPSIAFPDGVPLLQFANSYGTGRNDAIRYDSPSIYGFIASATWGDDNYWDVALRFAKEWNSVKIAAAIAYANAEPDPNGGVGYTGGDQEILSGSVSMMHMPTGLFINFGTGTLEDDADNESSFFFVQGGIERKWLSYGTTTLHAEYGNYEDQLTLFEPGVTSSEATRWGFGIVQHFDSAALDLYAQATFWDFDVEGGEVVDDDVNDNISTIMIGAKIDF
jgi:Gram-negative porin